MLITLNQITKIYRLGEVGPVSGAINKVWSKLFGRSISLGRFTSNGVEIPALRGVSLTVEQGEFVAIIGPSGSGKTTLMNIIGCLDRPTAGKYFLEGTEVTTLNQNDLSRIRNKKIGFVFQNFNLLPRTSALENVELPLCYGNTLSARQKHQRAREMLERLGLGDRLSHHPGQLSGGEQQRVAIARALINQPSLILADEPTGNLDSISGQEIMSIFQRLNREGITIILITHEKDIAAYARRLIQLKDGKIV